MNNSERNNIYIATSVGSRETPKNIGELQAKFCWVLGKMGCNIRTGDARLGGDKYTRLGMRNLPEQIEVFGPNDEVFKTETGEEVMRRAATFHPYFDKIKSDYVKRLHARNLFQVEGINLNDPSDVLICWTSSGAKTNEERLANFSKTGGTGQAISVADYNKVPIYNMGNESDYKKIFDFVYKGIPYDDKIQQWLLKRKESTFFVSPNSKEIQIIKA